MKIRVAITTLGCKVNQVESAALDNAFAAAGCALVDFREQADIYVVNSCAVTARAGQQSRQVLRNALRRNPEARVLITGCYAQIAADTLRAIDPRVLLIGNSHKEELVAVALGRAPAPALVPMAEKQGVFALPVRHFPGHSRAFLRIQDGCSNFCSYCIVPYTRGRSRSLPLQQVMQQAGLFAEAGYREIVVTGINVGRYGLDLAENETIVTVLARLCTAFPEIRFRLSSIEPPEIDAALLDMAAAHPNCMPHFHIPLQSGDDRALAAMRRRYRSADFAGRVQALRARLPLAAVGCDVLTGFPGETEAQAANTRALLQECAVSFLHVFPYSRRPGTPAAGMPDQVPAGSKSERAGLLRKLDADLRRHFYAANLGRVLRILVERRRADGMLEGFSENYIPVRLAGPEALVGKIAAVRLLRVDAGGPLGILETGA